MFVWKKKKKERKRNTNTNKMKCFKKAHVFLVFVRNECGNFCFDPN